IISLTRNYCCHHARVWNKQNTIRPMLPNHTDYAWLTLPTDSLRIYFDISIIKYFLNIISPQNDMRDKLMKRLSDFPNIDTAAMGFPVGLQQEQLWL
ncbi:MAG: Abi family protein, partial [Bacteroidales bacterium]|nr:Abi family protein [Bacteroidales bacterium]